MIMKIFLVKIDLSISSYWSYRRRPASSCQFAVTRFFRASPGNLPRCRVRLLQDPSNWHCRGGERGTRSEDEALSWSNWQRQRSCLIERNASFRKSTSLKALVWESGTCTKHLLNLHSRGDRLHSPLSWGFFRVSLELLQLQKSSDTSNGSLETLISQEDWRGATDGNIGRSEGYLEENLPKKRHLAMWLKSGYRGVHRSSQATNNVLRTSRNASQLQWPMLLNIW
jgi:hypothetical protein